MTIHVRPLPDGGWEARGTQEITAHGPTRDEAVQAFGRLLARQARSAFPIVEFPAEPVTKLTS